MKLANLARKHIDRRLAPLRTLATELTTPSTGWVRAIRQAMGMPSTQLAVRLGLTQSGVVQLEQSEKRGSISLNTLRKAAEALDCTLVYALVPNKALEEIVYERAGEIAAEQLARVNHSMRLEAQGVEDDDLQAEHARLRSELLAGNPARLWNNL